jgi:hypothetical protein
MKTNLQLIRYVQGPFEIAEEGTRTAKNKVNYAKQWFV